MQVIDHPAKGLSLVPVDIRSQLDDFATGGHPKAIVLARRAHRRGHFADPVTSGVAVVHGDTKALVLDDNTGNRAELLAQFGGRLFQHRDGRSRGVVLMVCSVGSGQLETVTAGVPDTGQTDAPSHVGKVPAGQHRDRTTRGQLVQCLARTGAASVAESGSSTMSDSVPSKSKKTAGLPGGEAVDPEPRACQCVEEAATSDGPRFAR